MRSTRLVTRRLMTWTPTMDEPRQIGVVEVRVDIPTDRIFFCEGEQKFVRWPELYWPLFCPICGRAVHAQLSSHHEMMEGE